MAAKELYPLSLFNDANLQAYWRMEGNSNDSKNAYNGSDTSITYSAANGKFGQGAGTSTGVIDFGNIFAFERTDSFSFSMWVNAAALSGFQGLIAKQPSGGGRGFFIYLYNSTINFDLQNTASSNQLNIGGAASLSAGTYSHIVVTYSGNSAPSGVKIYCDGSEISLTTVLNSLSATIVGTDTLKIGRRASGDSQFSGKIDDVAIFNRVLTPTEVTALYNGTFNSRFGSFFPFFL